ncbi:MAG: VacB/RNase II family 3'-5' exoribonuclease, partial [Syntrophomonadaceae bacterium]|nr:VacB/RNase II family 3'-5' exoribonuclease [Syntrophomonadaceae bacterium]
MLDARDIKNYMEREDYVPLSYEALRRELTSSVGEYGLFAKVLGKMTKAGEVTRTSDKCYRLPKPEEFPIEPMPMAKYIIPQATGNRRGDWQLIVDRHGLRARFPARAWEEGEAAPQAVSAADIAGRRDLRNLRMVTIDGADAKDLDDAISVEALENEGLRLGVHIADVSHYVKPGSALDKEARARATSVYLLDRVLPMLPPRLSNGICSLNAGVERLAVSCCMDFDRHGAMMGYEIFKAVICIDRRLTYDEVNRLFALPDDPEAMGEYGLLRDDLLQMKRLAESLRAQRMRRGALDFDFPESKIIVNDEGFPLEVKRAERGAGEMLIEDFMIKANETVAQYLRERRFPLLYRVHEPPDPEGLARLNLVLGAFALKLPTGSVPSPKDCQQILSAIKGRPEEQTVSLMLLRSMRHACYTPAALGHFGLASDSYCHFTSPIRRYPDLIVHRVLSSVLDNSMTAEYKKKLAAMMGELGQHCTEQEICAEEAERDLRSMKKAQYIHQFLGEEYEAR